MTLTPPLLDIQDLTILRGKRRVLHISELAVIAGEMLAVVGPNGAGKSTLLLAVAHLIPRSGGSIIFNGKDYSTCPQQLRQKIALVLQEPLLLHTSVFENVAAGLRFHHLPKAEINRRVSLWLERLGITTLVRRSASTLSGGEAQRVSLARAFALQSELLLLDEPFSALDAPTRASLLADFHTILSETRQTALFVTHDLDEALLLGTRMAVILNGELRQVDKPDVVCNTPVDAEVASFVGVETIIPGMAQSVNEGLTQIMAYDHLLEAVGEVPPGREVYLCLRPEDITLWRDGSAALSSARNRLRGRVARLTPQGVLMRVVVDCGFPLVALVTRASAQELDLQPGVEVTASFKATAAHLMAR
jgi:tungstate transport system ATP-binding protein